MTTLEMLAKLAYEKMVERLEARHPTGYKYPWEEEAQILRDDWIASTRAAVEKLKETTKTMCDAGHLKMPVEISYWQSQGRFHIEMLPRAECVPPESVFVAMLDVVLEGKS